MASKDLKKLMELVPDIFKKDNILETYFLLEEKLSQYNGLMGSVDVSDLALYNKDDKTFERMDKLLVTIQSISDLMTKIKKDHNLTGDRDTDKKSRIPLFEQMIRNQNG
jgi:hypothetical protein